MSNGLFDFDPIASAGDLFTEATHGNQLVAAGPIKVKDGQSGTIFAANSLAGKVDMLSLGALELQRHVSPLAWGIATERDGERGLVPSNFL